MMMHRRVSHRLYRQIYLSFLAVLMLFAVLAGTVIWIYNTQFSPPGDEHRIVPILVRLLPAQESVAAQTATLNDIAVASGMSLALYSAAGSLIAQGGSRTMPTTLDDASKRQLWNRPLALPDGRHVVLVLHNRGGAGVLATFVTLALLAALGAYPVAKRLTRRLVALQRQAEAWGEGDLTARALVDGRDEVAELSRRFNQAAERVQSLIDSQRAMLAAASHELRSPLARIQMAFGLMGDQRPDLQAQVVRDIAELDALIGDLLLASRLSVDTPLLNIEDVELLALAAEEAARGGATISGKTIQLPGDARLLRLLVRNLLDNVRRYAPGVAAEVEVGVEAGKVVLRVLDRGPGIPESEREKIFEPFYRLAGTPETGGGVGYGLALVKRIARLHGGDIRCLPRVGGGSCFEVNLGAARSPR